MTNNQEEWSLPTSCFSSILLLFHTKNPKSNCPRRWIFLSYWSGIVYVQYRCCTVQFTIEQHYPLNVSLGRTRSVSRWPLTALAPHWDTSTTFGFFQWAAEHFTTVLLAAKAPAGECRFFIQHVLYTVQRTMYNEQSDQDLPGFLSPQRPEPKLPAQIWKNYTFKKCLLIVQRLSVACLHKTICTKMFIYIYDNITWMIES